MRRNEMELMKQHDEEYKETTDEKEQEEQMEYDDNEFDSNTCGICMEDFKLVYSKNPRRSNRIK